MKTILMAAAALSFLAVTAYAVQSKAADGGGLGVAAPVEADLMDVLVQEDGVGDDVLESLAGRELIEPDELTQIAAPTNNNTSTNEIELNGEGSSLVTGFVAGNQANSGGINNQMINSGNGVNFQNSTVIQIIVGE